MATTFDPGAIRALTFDVFGTVVDWRGSIIDEGQLLSHQLGLAVDWPAFADAWRAGYRPAMARARVDAEAWANIDVLHRQILDGLLPRFGLELLSEAQREHLNHVWHRLRPWPDAIEGLQRLRTERVVTTLSNGNLALLVDMAKHAGLPWDCVLSAELFRRYKPEPEVYQGAARLLGLEPGQVMMVACHPSDLVAARRAGLRSAYVPRPLEHGPSGHGEPVGDAVFDLVASDFIDLARRLAG